MSKITYKVVPITRYMLKREVEAERRGILSLHVEDVGPFDTIAQAEEFADRMKLIDDKPILGAGVRWALESQP